jgi:hypothetical protein
MSRLTRDLRDATAATPAGTGIDSVITRATPQDLVMRRINPFGTAGTGDLTGAQTIRWCLNPDTGRLHRQVAAGVAMPGTACPEVAAGWTNSVHAQMVANATRPVFTYDGAAVNDISNVGVFLAIDRKPGALPNEATLKSGVFLRNQNRKPVASFTYVSLPGRNIQLNAQPSRDPEGGILNYEWWDNGTKLNYTGAVASYVAPAVGPRFITLKVRDADHLVSEQSQSVEALP